MFAGYIAKWFFGFDTVTDESLSYLAGPLMIWLTSKASFAIYKKYKKKK
jgi:hypothetical protein